LKHYISNNPQEFKNYFNERRHELGLMKSVLRNLTPGQKVSLRAHYEQQKQMSAQDFYRLASLPPPTISKTNKRTRKRNKIGQGESYHGGIWSPQQYQLNGPNWDTQTSITEILS